MTTRAKDLETDTPSLANPDGSRWPPARRMLAALVVVVVLLGCAELGVRALGDRLPPAGDWPTPEYGLKARHLDKLRRTGGAGVVALGSSVVDVSFDPALLTPKVAPRGAYNAGILGTSPQVLMRWAELFVFPATRPDVVLIALSSRDLNANGVTQQSLAAQFADAGEVRHRVGNETRADRIQRSLERASALLGRRQWLRSPLQSLGVWKPATFAVDLKDNGFDEELADEPYRGDDEIQAFYRRDPLNAFRINQRGVEGLSAFVQRLRTDRIRVVFIDVPVTELYIGLHPNGRRDYDTYKAAVRDLAKRTGTELLAPGVWPDSFFADPLHLNRAGVHRLTEAIDRHLARGLR